MPLPASPRAVLVTASPHLLTHSDPGLSQRKVSHVQAQEGPLCGNSLFSLLLTLVQNIPEGTKQYQLKKCARASSRRAPPNLAYLCGSSHLLPDMQRQRA